MLHDLLLIIVLQLIYVPIYSLVMILMVKGFTHIASILSIFEVLIYVYGLSIVLQGDKAFVLMIVYAIANGCGLEIGAFIESKLAFGYLSFEIFVDEKNESLISEMKKKGLKLHIYDVKGRENWKYCIETLTSRKREKEIQELVSAHMPHASIIMYEPYDVKIRNPLRKRKSLLSRLFLS